ncbi:Kinase, NEK [Giardia duodenalis]|uniref:non-specific serine/threonine protein kinase n=1 Tax=Giardia intestinalis (strain ATCC 50803 / WB clone C6) TaxID=184922 RepID=A8B5W5_GIAIC|nr:Kinase, NEK [Giardia intestinalis]KAE8305090.1 Kinase, NEK [Giardia intestinalis]|eukprot:XP_001709320.1 Kinase, NEK-frag [Giardia lamblia ATCC 50803]
MSLVLSALGSSGTENRLQRSGSRHRGLSYKSDRLKVSLVLSVPKTGPSAEETLKEDIRFIDRLKHPHISRITAAVKDKSDYYEVCLSTHIEGQTLRDLIDCKAADSAVIAEDKVWAILAQLLDAAAACQRLYRSHLNIAPSNIYISDLYYVKLGRPLLTSERKETTTWSSDTTPYKSLEVISGTSFSPASDVWSIGCIVYELCTLTPLFTARSVNDMLQDLQEISRLEFIPGYSADLFLLLTQMLAVDEAARISASDALRHPRIRHSVGQFRYNIETELSELTFEDLPELFTEKRVQKLGGSQTRRQGGSVLQTCEPSTRRDSPSCKSRVNASATAVKGAIRNLAISRLSMSLQECVKMAENKNTGPSRSAVMEDRAARAIKHEEFDGPVSSPDLAMSPGESAIINSLEILLRPCDHVMTTTEYARLLDLRRCPSCGGKVKSIEFINELTSIRI